MKRGLVWGIAAFLIASGASNVYGGSWYAELGYGASEGDLFDSTSRPFDVDDQDSRWNISLGYEINPYVSVEAGYLDLGKQEAELRPGPLLATLSPQWLNPFTGSYPPPSSPPFDLPPSGPIIGVAVFDPQQPPELRLLDGAPASQIETEARGIRFAVNGNLPLGERFALHLHTGALLSRYENEFSTTLFTFTNGVLERIDLRETEVSRDLEWFLGAGGSFNINESFALKLIWERYLDVGDGDDTLEQDIDSYSLNLSYSY